DVRYLVCSELVSERQIKAPLESKNTSGPLVPTFAKCPLRGSANVGIGPLAMLPQADRQHRAGIALIVAAAIAWSTAASFVRLLHFDSWTILFWRGLFGGGFIALFLVLTQGRRGMRDLVAMKANGWLVACLSTVGMVTFIPALQLTSVANAAIIVATQPFVAAAIAWIWLREAVQPRTMLASLVALAGIVVIVSGAA